MEVAANKLDARIRLVGGGPYRPDGGLTGAFPTDQHPAFGSALMGDQAMRLYLLARGNTTLGIEIDDLSGGAHFDDYSAIVEQFQLRD